MGNTEQVAFDNDTHGSEITKLMANSNSNNNLTQQLIKIFKKETKEDNIFYKFSNSDFSNHMKDWYKSTPAKTYITNTLKARYTKDLPDDITKRTREQTKIFHRLLTDEQHGM